MRDGTLKMPKTFTEEEGRLAEPWAMPSPKGPTQRHLPAKKYLLPSVAPGLSLHCSQLGSGTKMRWGHR